MTGIQPAGTLVACGRKRCAAWTVAAHGRSTQGLEQTAHAAGDSRGLDPGASHWRALCGWPQRHCHPANKVMTTMVVMMMMMMMIVVVVVAVVAFMMVMIMTRGGGGGGGVMKLMSSLNPVCTLCRATHKMRAEVHLTLASCPAVTWSCSLLQVTIKQRV
eukprot:586368-Pelagomonas_calceolata.AAC.6